MLPLSSHEMVLNQHDQGRRVDALISKHRPIHDSFEAHLVLVRHEGPCDKPHQRLLQNGLV